MMTVLLVFKTLSMLFESIRFHYLGLTGAAEAWSIVYYLFAFLKGITLFVVMLLIGSGWSLIKPFLHARDKKIIVVVLSLQVRTSWYAVRAWASVSFVCMRVCAMYVRVCAFMCVYAQLCAYMLVNVRCMCVYAHAWMCVIADETALPRYRRSSPWCSVCRYRFFVVVAVVAVVVILLLFCCCRFVVVAAVAVVGVVVVVGACGGVGGVVGFAVAVVVAGTVGVSFAVADAVNAFHLKERSSHAGSIDLRLHPFPTLF